MSPNSPSSYSLVGNLSGMLLNTDMVLDYPRPQPPTFLNIGGIQVTLFLDALASLDFKLSVSQ